MDDESPRNDGKRSLSRREALKITGVAGLAGLAGCAGGSGSEGGGQIDVGLLADRTGSLAATGIPMHNVAQVWEQQVNDRGGILDREVNLIAPDPQSDNQQYQNQARGLILEDQVDVLVGGITSASREAFRPIVDEEKQLYFYPTQYEGGVCDSYTYVTAPTATQQLRPLVEYMMENVGTEAYFMAADYNFGQISADWARIYVEEAGGSVVGEEFVPLSTGDFESTINRISDADPDWVLSLTVGAAHAAFYEQSTSAGLDIPKASTTAVGGNYEHLTLSPPTMENVYGAWNYLEELDNEANREFVSAVNDAFPDNPYVNQMAIGTYQALLLYEEAVNQAETTDMETVSETLEEGISVMSPQGEISVDPPTHHVTHDIYVDRVTEDHSIEILETREGLEPTWLQDNCDLTQHGWDDPRTELLTPDN
jgi:branched-chain amino acid transport system substrate-binding protein